MLRLCAKNWEYRVEWENWANNGRINVTFRLSEALKRQHHLIYWTIYSMMFQHLNWTEYFCLKKQSIWKCISFSLSTLISRLISICHHSFCMIWSVSAVFYVCGRFTCVSLSLEIKSQHQLFDIIPKQKFRFLINSVLCAWNSFFFSLIIDSSGKL